MGFASLRDCVNDLEKQGHLVRIDAEVDPYLEAAEIQRRVYAAAGPALLFTRLKGCSFPAVSNLFGTMKRAEHVFRDSLEGVRALVLGKTDPMALLRAPMLAARAPLAALHMIPRSVSRAAVLEHETTISALPPITSWRGDGGPFITLPQVYTEDPDRPGWRHSNLGMYRVQLSGNQYERDREVGLHYQIHRGIGVHHSKALARGEKLRVNVFVGGPPAMSLAAVMPLPEGLPELAFAGAMNARAVRLAQHGAGPPVHADADFCIRGWIEPETKPEGPFGDHLGYYSLVHDFPVMHVESVHHREGAIWPFTVVGRPPQEDTVFGELIHALTGPLIPDVLPGVRAVNAVDAAGVHPLLLAIGSERYVPYAKERRPMELLTQASAILGQGQMSLAKFLFIVAGEDAASLDVKDIGAFFAHVLERIEPARDLHFICNTTIDTLDYSGSGFNAGSKVIVAAAGEKRRALATSPSSQLRLPSGFSQPRVAMPGALVITAPPFESPESAELFCSQFGEEDFEGFPLVVLADDAAMASRTLRNFLWVVFTRSNPAVDVHGIGAFTSNKAWGCRGSLVFDARVKPHHAAPLVEDPRVSKRVDALAVSGGPLAGLF